jgi:hypothetical protein
VIGRGLALLALAALAAAAGCAAAERPGGDAERYGALDARKDDIRELWMQIRDWRVELAMPADPTPGDAATLAQAIGRLRRCRMPDAAPPEGTCGDVCNLKDAICDNAVSICRIAAELDGDAWADGKCASAKASCKEATDRCCACAARLPAAP